MKLDRCGWGALFGLIFVLMLGPRAVLRASDHIDGPVTIGHAVADISDLFAFPSPHRPGRLALILNVYSGVAVDGHFSDKVAYHFLVRQARASESAGEAAFETWGDYRVTCTFETPHGFAARHHVTCTSSRGTTVRAQVDELGGQAASGLRVFAGRRSDPFFFNAGWAVAASTKGVLLPPKDSNVMQNMNVLSIVVEVDLEKELGPTPSALLAVAAETTTDDGATGGIRRIDRIGRPEITNFTLVAHAANDLRDLYNAEHPFDLSAANAPLYRQRLRENIAWYDKLNQSLEWTEQSRNRLAEILLNDFLVVDVARPCGAGTYFEIEQSLLSGTPHTSCGGRVPNDDVMDVIYTLLINGGREPRIRDGVDRPTRLATEVFPYLAAPSGGPLAAMKNFVGRAAGKLTVSGRLRWLGVAALLAGAAALIGTVLAVVLGLWLLAARIRQRQVSAKLRSRGLVLIAACFGIAGICGIVSGAFSSWEIGILVLVVLGALLMRRT